MDELRFRLAAQILWRPGPWIAKVEGIEAERVRQVWRDLSDPARPIDLMIGDEPVDKPPLGEARQIHIGPRRAEQGLAPRWWACRITEVGGEVPEADRWLEDLGSEALIRQERGVDRLFLRGWWLDARYFVQRLRDLAYRRAATTWEDGPALRRVAEAEERAARLAEAEGRRGDARGAWRTAGWIWSELPQRSRADDRRLRAIAEADRLAREAPDQ